jgi:hypothetical protein
VYLEGTQAVQRRRHGHAGVARCSAAEAEVAACSSVACSVEGVGEGDLVGKISNLQEDLIHENSEQNMAENMEIKLTMFTSERYEQSISSISKMIASPRN